MRILKRAKAEETDIRYPLRRPVTASVALTETGDMAPSGFGVMRKYRMVLTIGCNFCANDAQLQEAKEKALRTLNAELYQDIYTLVHRMENAAHSNDFDSVFAILRDIKAEIGASD